MIISAAPFRVSFAGGGSDIPVYFRRHKGAVLSVTIDKHIYVSVHPYFDRRRTLLKYSRNELVEKLGDIEHPVFREVLGELWPEGGLEIVSTADIPSGTGMGSSSSFTVALLNALYAYSGRFASKEHLARKACEIEMVRLNEPIGKQDQYAAAFGGLNLIEFQSDGSVQVSPLVLPSATIRRLQQNLLLFYLGGTRRAHDVLQDQARQLSSSVDRMDNLTQMVQLAYEMRDHLVQGRLDLFAQCLHKGWLLKRTLCAKISNHCIDGYYQRALEYGAAGGKLLGAGGAGFLLLYCEPERQDTLRKALFDCPELPFGIDWAGARIIYVGERHTEQGFVC
jgi:D-glycero-alpha-D-manno-heptose-7-phosphate kinase